MVPNDWGRCVLKGKTTQAVRSLHNSLSYQLTVLLVRSASICPLFLPDSGSFMFFSVFPCESLEVCAQESMVQCWELPSVSSQNNCFDKFDHLKHWCHLNLMPMSLQGVNRFNSPHLPDIAGRSSVSKRGGSCWVNSWSTLASPAWSWIKRCQRLWHSGPRSRFLRDFCYGRLADFFFCRLILRWDYETLLTELQQGLALSHGLHDLLWM